MERKVAALVLIAAGVWVQWGPGFGLIVAGALLGGSGLEVPTGSGIAAVRRGWWRARGVLVAMPRRTAAAVLVAVCAVTIPAGALLAWGAWAALGSFGSIAGIAGAALGRE
jgi:hypothetical protein